MCSADDSRVSLHDPALSPSLFDVRGEGCAGQNYLNTKQRRTSRYQELIYVIQTDLTIQNTI